jgi:hypothetical protein
VRPRITGKLTTVFLMSLMVGVLFGVRFVHTLFVIALIMMAVSYVDYLRAGIKQIGNEDES